jgi:hypothetical protein
LGIESSQLAAIARWVHKKHGAPPRIVSIGPRSGLIATVAAALEMTAIAELDLQQPLDSLKDVIKKNMTLDQAPELFCFGLLEHFDLPQLYALGQQRLVATGPLNDFLPGGKSAVKGPKSKAKGGPKTDAGTLIAEKKR